MTAVSGFTAGLLAGIVLILLNAGCSEEVRIGLGGPDETSAPDGSVSSRQPSRAADVPVDGVSTEWVAEFNRGDPLFDLVLRESDGLGPLYTRQSCSSCHGDALRGSGFVQKMSVVQSDGVTPDSDQSALPFGHTVHPFTAGGATTPVVPPPVANVRVSTRFGPPVLGRGYMEAILDDEIIAVASAQSNSVNGVHGRVNYVTYTSQLNTDTRFHNHQPGDTVIGRFGLKARIATLDDFAADAMQGDMGITSPLRPTELLNPDNQLDDLKIGVDASIEDVNQRANYTRLLAIPPRRWLSGNGDALFAQVQCSTCHVASMRTRADYPIEVLAGIDAPIYSDLLLHDMGDGLADSLGTTDGEAGPRDWRTAPLIGLRYLTTYLHDSRAKTIRDSIIMHDGNESEAHDAVTQFLQLSDDDQQTLILFVGAL